MSKRALLGLLALGTLAGCVPYPEGAYGYGYTPPPVATPAPYYGGDYGGGYGYAPYYAPEPGPTIVIGGGERYRDDRYRDRRYYRDGRRFDGGA